MAFTIVALVLVLSQSHPTVTLGTTDIWRTMITIMIALTSGMINTHSTTPSTLPNIHYLLIMLNNTCFILYCNIIQGNLHVYLIFCFYYVITISGLLSLASSCSIGNDLVYQNQHPYDTNSTSYIFPPSLVVFGIGGMLLCVLGFVLLGDIIIRIKPAVPQAISPSNGPNLLAPGHQHNPHDNAYPAVPITSVPVASNVYSGNMPTQAASTPLPYALQYPVHGSREENTSSDHTSNDTANLIPPNQQARQQNQRQKQQHDHQSMVYDNMPPQ